MGSVTRLASGNVTVDLSWFGDELTDHLSDLIIEELTVVFHKMVRFARQLCPVGTAEKTSPMYQRRSLTSWQRGSKRRMVKKYRHVSANQSKLGMLPKKKSHFIKYDYRRSARVERAIGKKWESRQPGRLRDSIRSTVAARRDKTAVLGFLEAGSTDAFYALFVEFGTYKMLPKPFLRPAFNAYKHEARVAVERACVRLVQEAA